MQIKLLAGIDEAGRGPLAGPVAVGVAVVPVNFDWSLIEGVRDSKQISSKNRGVIFTRAKQLKKEGKLDFVVAMVSAKVIDEKGIARAITTAMNRAIQRLQLNSKDCFIKLDGSLRAPSEFSQETIIKGDSKEKVIGLASICAKETRDTYMVSLAKKYPEYELEAHKGYGTKSHRRQIFKNGTSNIHRQSYCQNAHMWGKV